MKKLVLPLLLISFVCQAQEQEAVDLQWKITDTLTYETVMKEIELKEVERESEEDSTSQSMFELLQQMRKQVTDLEYETKLFPDKNGNVDIAMMIKEDMEDTTESFFSNMAKLNGNVVLRGRLSPEGKLLSFYYKQQQKNILSLLFELPNKAVRTGDEWKVDVNMISLDQNFKADSMYKKNRVKLKDVKVENGLKIALIEYEIEEYVSGQFGKSLITMFVDDQSREEIFIRFTHTATAQFDLENGCWISYDGIMAVETNQSLMGIKGNKKTEFKLRRTK